MITGMNYSKSLTKNISCKCKCKFDRKNVSQIKIGIKINVSVSVKIQKTVVCVKKFIFGILLLVVVKMPHITSQVTN